MKKLFLIILIVYANFIQAQIVNINDLVLTCNKISIFKNNRAKIEIRLLNKSKDTLKYRSMSCSWQEFYSCNSGNINIAVNECDKNIPVILILNPNESRIVTLTMIAKKPIPNYFKLGLKIGQIEKPQLFISNSKVENCQIIWSSTISTRK